MFTNKRVDLVNLRRLLPEERLTYVAPGLAPAAFTFDPAARAELRGRWRAGEEPVVLSVAMFRPGVKTEGLIRVIRACGELRASRPALQAGDRRRRQDAGPAGGACPRRAARPGAFCRAGAAARSCTGTTAPPTCSPSPASRNRSGMVYLEAQSCGLPVVACDNAGVPEAVRHGLTGLLVPPADAAGFAAAIDRLLGDAELRRRMGAAGRAAIRECHDLDRNYAAMEEVLKRVVKRINDTSVVIRTMTDTPITTRFGLIRHAETVWNRERRIQGQQDSPLTPHGRRQAEPLGGGARPHRLAGDAGERHRPCRGDRGADQPPVETAADRRLPGCGSSTGGAGPEKPSPS